MSLDIQKMANEFSLSEEALTRESLRSFLLEQLRTLDAEQQARCAEFGVTVLAEMDELLKRGAVTEEEILEDFQDVDYLTTRVERIKFGDPKTVVESALAADPEQALRQFLTFAGSRIAGLSSN